VPEPAASRWTLQGPREPLNLGERGAGRPSLAAPDALLGPADDSVRTRRRGQLHALLRTTAWTDHPYLAPSPTTSAGVLPHAGAPSPTTGAETARMTMHAGFRQNVETPRDLEPAARLRPTKFHQETTSLRKRPSPRHAVLPATLPTPGKLPRRVSVALVFGAGDNPSTPPAPHQLGAGPRQPAAATRSMSGKDWNSTADLRRMGKRPGRVLRPRQPLGSRSGGTGCG